MRRQIPSIQALLCLEAAGHTENFARAAETLNLTQSTLSRHIQSLEAFLGQRLFDRHRQRVRLTNAGRQLLAELSPQLATLEATLLRASTHAGPAGAVNIGVYPTLGARWLMPGLMEFAARNEKLTVNTITYLSNAEIDPALVDIGIVQGDPPFSGFEATFLMAETLVVAASPDLIDCAVTDPDQLLSYRILQHVTRPLSWEIWFDGSGHKLWKNPIGPSFSQFEMLIDAVRRGYGIAVLPKILIRQELAAGELVLAHEAEVTPPSAYYLVIPTAKVGAPRILRTKQALLQLAEDREEVSQRGR